MICGVLELDSVLGHTPFLQETRHRQMDLLYACVCLCVRVYVWVCLCECACVCTDTDAWQKEQKQVEWLQAASDRKLRVSHFLSEDCRGLKWYGGARSLSSNRAPDFPAPNPPHLFEPLTPDACRGPASRWGTSCWAAALHQSPHRQPERGEALHLPPSPPDPPALSPAPSPTCVPMMTRWSEPNGIYCFNEYDCCCFSSSTDTIYIWSVVLNW